MIVIKENFSRTVTAQRGIIIRRIVRKSSISLHVDPVDPPQTVFLREPPLLRIAPNRPFLFHDD